MVHSIGKLGFWQPIRPQSFEEVESLFGSTLQEIASFSRNCNQPGLRNLFVISSTLVTIRVLSIGREQKIAFSLNSGYEKQGSWVGWQYRKGQKSELFSGDFKGRRAMMLSGKEEFRILLADDHALIRHGIKNILKADESLKIVGEVSNGEELMAFLEAMAVDLIILDISMPGVGGMESLGRVKSKYPAVKILMLTMYNSKQYFYDAMSAGANGYLMKDDPDGELLVAITKVLSGKNYVSPHMVGDFANDVITMYRNEKRSPFQELTKREKEVLHLIVKGFTSKQMAENLHVSHRTIDHHRANLLRKFNRKNSAEMVNYAVRNGFVSAE